MSLKSTGAFADVAQLRQMTPEALNKKVIFQQPFLVTITSQNEPIVGGFGFGLRSRLLGYFLRADWAWGVENREILPYRFYFSLGLDF